MSKPNTWKMLDSFNFRKESFLPPKNWMKLKKYKSSTYILAVLGSLIIIYSLYAFGTHPTRAIPLSLHKTWYPKGEWEKAVFPPKMSHSNILASLAKCISSTVNEHIPMSIYGANLLEMIRSGRSIYEGDKDFDFIIYKKDLARLRALKPLLEHRCGVYVNYQEDVIQYVDKGPWEIFMIASPVARVYWSRIEPIYADTNPLFLDIWAVTKITPRNEAPYWNITQVASETQDFKFPEKTFKSLDMPCPIPRPYEDLSAFRCPSGITELLESCYGPKWPRAPCDVVKTHAEKAYGLVKDFPEQPHPATTLCYLRRRQIRNFMNSYPYGREQWDIYIKYLKDTNQSQ